MENKVAKERAEDAAASIVGRGDLLEHLFSYLMGISVSELLLTTVDEQSKREANYYQCMAINELKAKLTAMAGESRRRLEKRKT